MRACLLLVILAVANLRAARVQADESDGSAEDPMAELVAGKEAELEARSADSTKADESDASKGAGNPTAEPEPDYLALADAPLFLPRNYLYWGTPVGPKGHREALVFALEYALHLPIYSNLRDNVLMGKHWAGAVTLSFEGALRMLANDSKPVRMPSYRPSVSGQLFYTIYTPAPLILSLRTSAFHYSNGQERCTFDASQDSESQGCQELIRGVSDPSAQLNRISGDFSMNGWLAELHGRVHEVNVKGVAIGHLALGLGLQGHIKRGPGAMDPPLRALYGRLRLQLDMEAKRRLGWAALTARGAFVNHVASASSVPGRAGWVEGVIDPYWLTGLGLFVRYYGGRDFYNAFFVDSVQQLSAGIAWDGERPLKFKQD
jgi:hypothetical protein